MPAKNGSIYSMINIENRPPEAIFFFVIVWRTVVTANDLDFGCTWPLCWSIFSARHSCQNNIGRKIHNRRPIQNAINNDQTLVGGRRNINKVAKSKTNYAPAKSKSHKKDLSPICVILSFEFNQIIVCESDTLSHTKTPEGSVATSIFSIFHSFLHVFTLVRFISRFFHSLAI